MSSDMDPGADEIFHEARDAHRPIRDLGLRIDGTRLEPILEAFRRELHDAGLTRVRPRFYLSSEWGVPFRTVAIAIPFYLASEQLARLHERHAGHVEGTDPEDILRYLRHEMGHVVNYAYVLHERPRWIELFGSMRRPYRERWRPRPFSREHVRHLPGWYAQKHPDEDWAETFATWLTPGRAWRSEYASWPVALAKLRWCDEVMAELADAEPALADDTPDEDVSEIAATPLELSAGLAQDSADLPLDLDGALVSAFADVPRQGGERAPAARLLRTLRPLLQAEIYRWTGHFPESTGRLVDHFAARAEALGLDYELRQEPAVSVAVVSLLTALAMTWVSRGRYSP